MQQTQPQRHALQIDLKQEQSHYSENRLAERYPTFCPVELDSGTGFTRNLSTLGVCFTTDSEIKPDLMLRYFILMQKKDKNIIRIRCEGRVVRANKSAGSWEIAIHFTTLEW